MYLVCPLSRRISSTKLFLLHTPQVQTKTRKLPKYLPTQSFEYANSWKHSLYEGSLYHLFVFRMCSMYSPSFLQGKQRGITWWLCGTYRPCPRIMQIYWPRASKQEGRSKNFWASISTVTLNPKILPTLRRSPYVLNPHPHSPCAWSCLGTPCACPDKDGLRVGLYLLVHW